MAVDADSRDSSSVRCTRGLDRRPRGRETVSDNTHHASAFGHAHPGGLLHRGAALRFSKPPLSDEEQLSLLEARGLHVQDRAKALGCLGHLNYYRLRAYWLGMESAKRPDGDHGFIQGANFDAALALYVFDRKLRLLVMDAIERVEVSVRTRWAHHLALKYGAHAHLDAALFKDPVLHGRLMAGLREEVDRSQETFIEHYLRTYDDPPLPPLWSACEVMSFGQLSRWVGILKYRADRQAIASGYGLDERVFLSFLHHLTTVRNLCAHHARLWNRRFTITMQLPRAQAGAAFPAFNPAADRNLYNTLAMLGLFLRTVSPGSSWAQRVRALMVATPGAAPAAMGFPIGWESEALWLSNAAPPSDPPPSSEGPCPP